MKKKDFSDFLRIQNLDDLEEDAKYSLESLNLSEKQKKEIGALMYSIASDLLLQYHEWLFSDD